MDTYTVTFTNGNTTTFTVTNGEKGDKGDKGDKGNTGNTGATGNGISTVAKTGTSGLVDTYTITFTNGTTTTFTVTNGADGTVPIVTSWESTLSDSKVPSEKLAKSSLDGKVDKVTGKGLSANDFTNSYKSTIDGLSTVATSGSYNDLSNKPSIPSSSSDLSDGSNIVKKSSTTGLLKNDGSVMASGTGSSNWAVGNHTHSAYVNPTKVTSWSSTPSDDNVASEKLIKNSLDGKLDNTIGSSAVTIASDDNILITDTSDNSKVKKVANLLASQVKDGSAHSNIGSSANATQSSINSSIDTALGGKQATLVSGTNIKTINSESILGSGNIVIQGGSSVDVVTSWEATLSDTKVPSEKLTKNTIDSKLDNALSSTTVSIASNDDILITDYSDSNKIKRVANILASQMKDSNAHSNIGSSANDTQATINTDINTALGNKVSKSSTSGLLKNDGSVDTNTYLTSSAISGMLTTSDIANNLTTTTTGKVLDASQGKALADLIGDAITYINQ